MKLISYKSLTTNSQLNIFICLFFLANFDQKMKLIREIAIFTLQAVFILHKYIVCNYEMFKLLLYATK